jgi:cyclase
MRAATRTAWVLGTMLALATPSALEAQELTIEQVKDGLYVIYGPGGNVGVRVTSEGVILVDDKFPQNFSDIQRLVRSVTDLPVRYVLNTHHHGDHSGSNAQFLPLAEVIAHRNARENMVRGNQDGLPRVVFTDETSIFLGGVEVRAYHMGTGHTNGDAVIYFPDLRTVHGGDLLHGTAPFIDYANGGSSKGWVGTINNILALPFDTAIPGHGAVMDRGDVTAFRNQMEAVRAHMADLVRSGMPASEAASRVRSPALSWTQAEQGLFMQRSIPGFYEEIAAEVGR